MADPRQSILVTDQAPPLAAGVQQFLDRTKTTAPRSRLPAMTSKQAKKAYLERTRGPKMSKEERRRRELEELARIKREEQEYKKQRDKERAATKARLAREKKKEKEDKENEEKRKQGLPLVAVHASQDMITSFFRGNGTARKREVGGNIILSTNSTLDHPAEQEGNRAEEDLEDRVDEAYEEAAEEEANQELELVLEQEKEREEEGGDNDASDGKEDVPSDYEVPVQAKPLSQGHRLSGQLPQRSSRQDEPAAVAVEEHEFLLRETLKATTLKETMLSWSMISATISKSLTTTNY